MGSPLPNAFLDIDHCVFDDGVARGLAGDLDGLQDGHAGADEGREGAAEAGHGDLLDDGPELHGQLQLEAVPGSASLLGVLEPDQRPDHQEDHREDDEPVALQHVADAHHHPGQTGQLAAQVVVHVGEDRDDEEQHADHDHDREHRDQDRVGHRRFDGPAQAVLLLELRGQAQERRVERATRLAGPHHSDIEAVERGRMFGHGVGKRTAGFDVVPHGLDDLLEAGGSESALRGRREPRSTARPELIMVANCRAKTALSRTLMRLLFSNKVLRSGMPRFSSRLTTVRPLRRSSATTAALESPWLHP